MNFERSGRFGLSGERLYKSNQAGRHVDQIQIFLEAKERLTSVYGSEPAGVLLLDTDRNIVQCDEWCLENLGLELETVLGADLKKTTSQELFRAIHQGLEFLGEIQSVELDQGLTEIVCQEGDVLSVGFWHRNLPDSTKFSDRNWILTSEVLREFMDVDSLQTLESVIQDVIETLGGGKWALYLPVQGSLSMVCGSTTAFETFHALMDPREFDEGFVIPAGYPDSILKAELKGDLTVAPMMRESRLACVFFGEGRQEDVVEIARWIGSALAKF